MFSRRDKSLDLRLGKKYKSHWWGLRVVNKGALPNMDGCWKLIEGVDRRIRKLPIEQRLRLQPQPFALMLDAPGGWVGEVLFTVDYDSEYLAAVWDHIEQGFYVLTHKNPQPMSLEIENSAWLVNGKSRTTGTIKLCSTVEELIENAAAALKLEMEQRMDATQSRNERLAAITQSPKEAGT